MNLQEIAEGSILTDKSGFKFVVIKNVNHAKVICRYINTGYQFSGQRSNIARGSCKDLMQPSKLGCYFGDGEYKESLTYQGKRVYSVWKNIITRCRDESNPNYHRYGAKGVDVCEQWLCFQVFAKWYIENYPKDGRSYQVDKDSCGKMLYSPETCVFLTSAENTKLSNAKTYLIEYADGRIEKVKSLREYAIETGRSQSVLSRISTGQFKRRRQNKDIVSIKQVEQ
jgi:hypothetical protein